MKKKKRAQVSKSRNVDSLKMDLGNVNVVEEDLKNLMEIFVSCSIEEAKIAYKSANGDVNRAAVILEGFVDSLEDNKSTSCSSSSCEDTSMMGGSSSSWNVGSSSSSGGSLQDDCGVNEGGRQKGRGKKVVAAAGTVSSMLGKDYVRGLTKRNNLKVKGNSENGLSKDDAEQFLCSMLGEECELSLAVVQDVLCQCAYDVEKALNVLLELSASSTTETKADENNLNTRDTFLLDSDDIPTDMAHDSISHTLDADPYDSIWSTGTDQRNYYKCLMGTEGEAYSSRGSEYIESELPQKVLESLFNMPALKNAEHEPNNMNWRNVVKKLTSLGQKVESYPPNGEAEYINQAKGDDYLVHRESAKQHWDSMRSYYQRAATAFANGEREHAAYLSEKGRTQNQRAREADEKASQDIFISRNKSIENVITIDLHGQHVKQAMKLLKLHLLFGAYVRSVRLFRVITGCGRHGVGKSKLKHTVIGLLDKEGIKYKEENSGTLLVKLDGQTDFSFLDTDSDED